MKFNSILKQTIQYTFTEEELDVLEQDIIAYVKEYEMYVFSVYSPGFLFAC